MAPTTAPSDPLKSLEGMWNGSLIRLANYFKDPAVYGQQTQTVLRETAKRYQDALDDCEIQILEAKWYLEHQLALNQARRAQQASESAHAANKRKLDSVSNEQHDSAEKVEENPAKRIKVEDAKDSQPSVAGSAVAGAKETAAVTNDESQKLKLNNEPTAKSVEAATESGLATGGPKEAGDSSQPTVTAPKKPPDLDTANGTHAMSTEIPPQDETKTSGPATSIDENQGFNFDSMFDDANDTDNGNNADLGFGMDLGTDPFANVISDQTNNGQVNNPGSLDSLLPDVQNYPNQTGEDILNTDSSNVGATGIDGVTGTQTDMWDLPDLGDSTFDDVLYDDSMGGGIGDAGDDMLNDDSMMNLGDLDSFFST